MDKKLLLDVDERCIYDEPAACTALCPIHVDIVLFMDEMKKGSFSKAYKVLEKRMPFARIIGMICDHPCEKACVRDTLDRAINISELERAAVSYGYARPKKPLSVPKNAGKVAVVGGGISGITAAYELDRKGFRVTIYEKSDRLGGSIWDYEGKLIDKEIIEEELKIISGIEVNYGSKIDKNRLESLKNEYDAVYLGTGVWSEELSIAGDTFEIGNSPVFAGGKLFTKNDSVIYAVSTGKRAAVSIERFVKKISMTASREREGTFETPLKYNLDDASAAPRIEKKDAVYSKEEAAAEAQRCLQCRCTECIKACSHLKKFNVSPKGYCRSININENVVLGTRYANKMINSCTECGLCGEQCPSGIGMKDIIKKTRESMVQKGKMPVSAHDFALKDMEFSNSERFFMVKSPPPIPPEQLEARKKELFTYPRLSFSKYAQSILKGDEPGTEQADYLFYPGCQLSASSPENVEKAYIYLVSNIKEGVGIMLGCCGAPAEWASRQDLLDESTKRIRDAWLNMGKPTFILACSSCCEIFEKHLPDIPYISLWEIIERYGVPTSAKKGDGHVLNIHDACSTRYNSKIHESVRNICAQLGYKIEELKYSKEKTKCCGYGGLVYFANREQSNEFVKDRVNESKDDLLVYCAMCKDLFVDGGKRTYHILDLLFSDDPDAQANRKMPTLSLRHENRANLKRRLLKGLWNEEEGSERNTKNNLVIPKSVWETMEKRYILREDVEKVVTYAESTGERFFNPENGSYLASLRIENVTYWVQYHKDGESVEIVSVYSHRMEVVKE